MRNPVIRSVSVRRLRCNVSYIPRYVVERLPDDTHVVSLEYFDRDRPDLSRFLSSYPITHAAGSDVGEHIDEILEYVKGLNGANVVVQCEMGSVRSKWVAHRIADRLGYTVSRVTRLDDGEIYRVFGIFGVSIPDTHVPVP